MTQGGVTYIRTLLALAVGAVIDLILFADTYPYGERYQHQSLAGINVIWLAVLLAFLGAGALGFGRQRQREAGSSSGWLARIDWSGLLIPSAIVIGQTITHTLVLIRDVAIDPTTHNLLPFEYIFMWIVVGIPAVAGSMLTRAMSWALNRFRGQ